MMGREPEPPAEALRSCEVTAQQMRSLDGCRYLFSDTQYNLSVYTVFFQLDKMTQKNSYYTILKFHLFWFKMMILIKH